jgi:hypothetical protein
MSSLDLEQLSRSADSPQRTAIVKHCGLQAPCHSGLCALLVPVLRATVKVNKQVYSSPSLLSLSSIFCLSSFWVFGGRD